MHAQGQSSILAVHEKVEGFMNGENSNKNNLGHTTDAVMETLTQV